MMDAEVDNDGGVLTPADVSSSFSESRHDQKTSKLKTSVATKSL